MLQRIVAAILLIGIARICPAAEFDLCVRGIGAEFSRSAHLHLVIEGADVAAFAPRLGAALANHRLWDNRATRLYGVAFDEDICGGPPEDAQRIELTVTDEEARTLAAETTRSGEAARPLPPAIAGRAVAAPAGEGPCRRPPNAAQAPYMTVPVYYGTDRVPSGSSDPRDHYRGTLGKLEYGVVSVTIPRDHKCGELETPSIWKLAFHDRADRTRYMTLERVQPLAADEWSGQVRKLATALDAQGILLFIHGFTVSFEDAALRTAQIAYDLNFKGAPMFFSWPTHGDHGGVSIKDLGLASDYRADEETVKQVIPQVREMLERLAAIGGPNTPIYVIAHSMGNRVLTNAFKQLLDSDFAARRSYRQLVLAAPDVDAAEFKNTIAPAILGRSEGPRVTLYASSHDYALGASRRLHGNLPRLGESSPHPLLIAGLDTVDASEVPTADILGHSYYGDNLSVISDLFYMIHEKLERPEQRPLTLEGVQAKIGDYWRFKAARAKAHAASRPASR